MLWLGAAGALVALVGCGAPGSKPGTTTLQLQVSRAPQQTASTNPTAPAPAPPAAVTTSPPTTITIPAIDVHSDLQALTLNKDGTLQTPSEWQRAGWYADGVYPGDPGPAVIAGHVDSVSGPAVFFRLKELKPGDRAAVGLRDGHTLTFQVDSVQEFAKNQFPTQAVYGPTATPVLRLITCTGDFDRAAHSYVDNLVVSAHLVG